MTAFDAAAKIILRDPNYGQAASYVPLGGTSRAIRVIVQQVSEEETLLSTGTRRPATRIDVLQADVSTRPAEGSTVTVDGVTYTIRQARPDSVSTWWMLDVDSV